MYEVSDKKGWMSIVIALYEIHSGAIFVCLSVSREVAVGVVRVTRETNRDQHRRHPSRRG